jgi:hypothetical protein
MNADLTLEDFANQTPVERKEYWASVDANMARRHCALSQASPAAVAAMPQEPAAARSPIDVTAIVEEVMARSRIPAEPPPPADPNAEAEALAAEIVASANRVTSRTASTPDHEALAAEIGAAAGQASGSMVGTPEAEALAAEIVAAAGQGSRS